MRTGAPSGPSTSTFSLTSLISTNTPHPPAWTGSEEHAAPPAWMASETEERWKVSTRIGGVLTKFMAYSRVSVVCAWPTSTVRLKTSTALFVNRKLLTCAVTSPFSMRYTPSRVLPVRSSADGSAALTYQNELMSRPRLVLAIIASRVVAVPLILRLSARGLNSWPWSAAHRRLDTSGPCTPLSIHVAGELVSAPANTER